MSKFENGDTVKHTRTGGYYIVINTEALIKCDDGQWVKGVLYRADAIDWDKHFLRTYKNFNEAFERVTGP